MREATTVVTHAGVGSILSARRAGHLPVVVPRLHALGEHVDDHQAELTRTLEAAGEVVAVWPGEPLAPVIAGAASRRPVPSGDAVRPIHRAVRAALLGDAA
jgi:UDP-N-acetylglucosamine transferase subunit ALG13